MPSFEETILPGDDVEALIQARRTRLNRLERRANLMAELAEKADMQSGTPRRYNYPSLYARALMFEMKAASSLAHGSHTAGLPALATAWQAHDQALSHSINHDNSIHANELPLRRMRYALMRMQPLMKQVTAMMGEDLLRLPMDNYTQKLWDKARGRD